MAKALTEDAIPDLHHKMCKKIAQLTKVIFHLHSKAEDHDNHLREQAETYEIQIEEVIHKFEFNNFQDVARFAN